MNWNIVDGNWRKLKCKVKARWGKLANNHMGSAVKIENASPEEDSMMQEKILSRRAVLRGALAVGLIPIVPITLFSSPAAAADAAAPAAKKVSKASVKYQHHPHGEQHCSTCINFIAESKTCKRVAGPIDPNGWCILWAKKA